MARLVEEDIAWLALTKQMDDAHARIKALLLMPASEATPELSAQLQKARSDLHDAEQAMLAFVALKRADPQRSLRSDAPAGHVDMAQTRNPLGGPSSQDEPGIRPTAEGVVRGDRRRSG
ncbi:MAG TPA: hypothetical protein VFO28_18105 [Burkholderiaceae bacterium]|nr:hypothetical protein [Burkholderiaceae bacterium]